MPVEPEESMAEEVVRERLKDEVVKELVHQRDLLGQTLGALLVAMEVVRDTDLTGPELVMAAEQVTEVYRATQSGDRWNVRFEPEDEEVLSGDGEVIGTVRRGEAVGPITRTEGQYIDVVFDGPPGPESGRFVEVEDQSGASVSVGEWIERDDGYWVLRMAVP